MSRISYTTGYQYRLSYTYKIQTDIKPARTVSTQYVKLTLDGELTVSDGYMWDGPSGIAIDTENFMRGSMVHDALYHLMRLDLLDADTHRKDADALLWKICIEDGMWPIRAAWVYWAVRLFGWRALS